MREAGHDVMVKATVSIAIVLATVALYLGHDLLVPITLALLLAALLEPVVGALRRLRVPTAAAAAIAIVATIVLLVGAGAALADPLRSLAAVIPASIAKAQVQLGHVSARLAFLRGGPPSAPTSGVPHAGASPGVAPNGLPGNLVGMVGRAFGTTSSLLAETIEILLLALFVLAAGDAWRDKLAAAVRSPTTRDSTLGAAREMRTAVRRYVLVTALINAGQGLLVALVAWLVGLASPPLWGVLTFVAEFVPYLGGAVLVALLFVVGLATTDSVGRALLAPAAYLAITTVQNNLVSPIAYGRNLCLSPVAILLAVMLWFALWGVAGAFLAVPILAAIRVLSLHVRALRPVGVFLEG